MLALLCLAGPTSFAAAWYDPDWNSRQKLTIQPTMADSDLPGFPCLVKITDAGNPLFTEALANGDDILFTGADGTTKLAHEIELYDNSAEELFAWVRVPLVSSTVATELYLYYGNGTVVSSEENVTGTWDSDFVMVQHLQETSGTHRDSTSYGNDGTPLNGVTQNATGRVDGADSFDGSNDKVDVADDPSLRLTELTLEAWVQIPGSIPSGFRGILGHDPSTLGWYGLFHNSNRFHFRWSNRNTSSVRRTDFLNTFSANQWYYIAGVLDIGADEARTYQNAALDRTISGPDPPTPTAGPTYIGHTFTNSEFFRGVLDEVRISRIARTPAWIIASARNQGDPDGYLTKSAPQVAVSISGTVFEDVNYGGGGGRDLATSAADAPSFVVGRDGVTVELYDNAGLFVDSATTSGGGAFTLTATSGLFTVRVVNDTVTSSRPGSDGSELAIQTYRSEGSGESVGTGATKVGGELPSNEDAAANAGAQSLASLQGTDLDTDGVPEWTQSIISIDTTGGDVSGVEFGFNFDTVVNTNDAGQGSLRQFILNSNLLN